MARNEIVVDAPPEAVWNVLADAYAYGHWVVGSRYIRTADADWPRQGTRFHHKVGVGPLTVADHTEAVVSEEPRRLVLLANARPLFGQARVDLQLMPEGSGTRVVMIENAVGYTKPLSFLPPFQMLIKARNVESLRRLKRLAERRYRLTARPATVAA